MPYETLDLTHRDHVAWITLRRPVALNALTHQCMKVLFDATDCLSSDP